jgi:hypothetical protein
MTRKARKPASEARPNTSADRLRVKSVAILSPQLRQLTSTRSHADE